MIEDWGTRAARWAGIRSETVRVGCTDVALLVADGPADGTPQLLVHGLGGASTNWLEVMVELAAFGPVVAPDLPGFGRTEPPSRRAARIPAQVRFLAALAAALGWDRLVLHGNSMGGLIALLTAARRGGLVERLVLTAPALPTPLAAVNRIPRATTVRFAPFVVPGLGVRVMRHAQARLTPEQMWDDTRALVHAEPSRVPDELRPIGIANLAFGREVAWRVPAFADANHSLLWLLIRTRGILAAIDAVTQPTLLLWGDRDRLVSRASIERAAARRPDWRTHVFDGVGHVPQLETPAAYLDVVGQWLETSDEPAA